MSPVFSYSLFVENIRRGRWVASAISKGVSMAIEHRLIELTRIRLETNSNHVPPPGMYALMPALTRVGPGCCDTH